MASYKKNILSNFVAQIVGIIVGLGTSVLVARELGPTDKGYIAYLLLIIELIASYGHFGVVDATTHFQKRSSYSEEDLFSSNITYLILVSIGYFIVIGILRYKKFLFCEYDIIFLLLGFIQIFMSLIFYNIRAMYIGWEKISQLNKYMIYTKTIYAFIIVLLFVINQITMFTYFIALIITTVLNTLFAVKNIKIKYRFWLSKEIIKQEFNYGKYIYISSLFIFLNYRVDQVMIKNILNEAHLGIYSVAVQLTELVFLVPSSIVSALTGKLYNLNDESKTRIDITCTTIKYTIYVCIILVAIGCFMIPLIPIVYGKAYFNAMNATAILFFGVIFASIGKVAAPYFFTKGNPEIQMKITAIVFFINFVLNFFLIPKIGINGSAVASTIAYFFYGMLYLLLLREKENIKLRDLLKFNSTDKIILKSIINKLKMKA